MGPQCKHVSNKSQSPIFQPFDPRKGLEQLRACGSLKGTGLWGGRHCQRICHPMPRSLSSFLSRGCICWYGPRKQDHLNTKTEVLSCRKSVCLVIDELRSQKGDSDQHQDEHSREFLFLLLQAGGSEGGGSLMGTRGLGSLQVLLAGAQSVVGRSDGH